jgi:hypothetical protein
VEAGGWDKEAAVVGRVVPAEAQVAGEAVSRPGQVAIVSALSAGRGSHMRLASPAWNASARSAGLR